MLLCKEIRNVQSVLIKSNKAQPLQTIYVEIVLTNVIIVQKTRLRVTSQYVKYVEKDTLKPMIKLEPFRSVLNVLSVKLKTVKLVILWIYKNVLSVLIIMLCTKINVQDQMKIVQLELSKCLIQLIPQELDLDRNVLIIVHLVTPLTST